jgi:hypothetical protein
MRVWDFGSTADSRRKPRRTVFFAPFAASFQSCIKRSMQAHRAKIYQERKILVGLKISYLVLFPLSKHVDKTSCHRNQLNTNRAHDYCLQYYLLMVRSTSADPKSVVRLAGYTQNFRSYRERLVCTTYKLFSILDN